MNFPDSPTLDQVYSFGNKSWKWNGSVWNIQAPSLGSNAVDNTVLADMAAGTVKGRAVGGGTGDPQDLSSAQLVDILAGEIAHTDVHWDAVSDKILGWDSGIPAEGQAPGNITCTAAGRALLDDADAAAQRTTLGLAIGTNVQAYDAELAALAGLTSAADRLPYFTGSGTASLATFTSFGRSLVDDADATAARSTLGLGGLAVLGAVTNSQVTAGTFSNITGIGTQTSNIVASTHDYSFNKFTVCQSGYVETSPINFRFDQDCLRYVNRWPASAGVTISYSGGFTSTHIDYLFSQYATSVNVGTFTAPAVVEITGLNIGSSAPSQFFPYVFLHSNDNPATVLMELEKAGNPGIWETAYSGSITNWKVAEYSSHWSALTGVRWTFTSLVDPTYIRSLGVLSRNGNGYAWNLMKGGDTVYGDLNFSTGYYPKLDGNTVNSANGLCQLDSGGKVASSQLDAELAALAGLTSAADRLPYFTGSGTASLATFTSFARTLLDDADATTMRTTLGLGAMSTAASVTLTGDVTGSGTSSFAATIASGAVTYAKIQNVGASSRLLGRATAGAGPVEEVKLGPSLLISGVNLDVDFSAVQAYDAELTALAGLTSAANKLPYFTGSGTASLADFTSLARTLVAQSTASAMFNTIAPTTGGDRGIIASDGAGSYLFVPFAGWPDGSLLVVDSAESGGLNYAPLAVNNSNWSGADLAVANGGTGASDAATARNNLDTERACSDLYVKIWDDQLEGYASAQNVLAGTGASAFHATDHVNSTENAIGEMACQTGSTSTGRCGWHYSQAAVLIGNGTAWNFEFRGATHSANSDGSEGYNCYMGFGDLWNGNGEPTDGVYFVYRQSVDGNFWVCVCRSNGVETGSKTVTSVAPGYTMRLFRIEVNDTGTSAVFKIDGTTVATITSNIPTGSGRQTGIGWKIEKTIGTAARYMYCDYVMIEAIRTSAR